MNVFDKNMAWIDQLGPGWHSLFRQLVSDLHTLDPTLTITQAKQKLGELRVYLDRYNVCAAALIRGAEAEARRTCETCGTRGGLTRSPRGYYETLCKAHQGDAKPAPSPIIARFSIQPRRGK